MAIHVDHLGPTSRADLYYHLRPFMSPGGNTMAVVIYPLVDNPRYARQSR